MVYSTYLEQRILHYHREGYNTAEFFVKKAFSAHETVSHLFLKHFASNGLMRKDGSGRKTKMTVNIKAIVEEQMTCDDETTAHQLCVLLGKKGYTVSLQTMFRCRSILGWTFRGSASSFAQLTKRRGTTGQ